MRKMTVLATMLALTALVMAVSPAMARDRIDRLEDRLENRLDRFDDDGTFFFFIGDDDFGFFDNDFDFDGDGVSQSFEQDSESGDVDQSFEISSSGDNANQCVNVQGVSNTGNVQDVSGFVSFDSDIDDFEQDDIGSDLTVDGNSDVSCDQQVNQAAAAG